MAGSFGGKRGGGLRISFKTAGMLRDPRGRFAPGNDAAMLRELTANNKQIAQRLQAQVVKNLAASYVRPTVSTGRLEKATADPENVFADQFGWGVGVPDFLDDSIAKYWRTIELGSAETWARGGMAGMMIYGTWGGSIAGYYLQARAYSAPSPTKAPRAAAPWAPSDIPGQGKLRGMFASTAQKYGIPGVEVHTEIKPHLYYQRAVDELDPFALTREQAMATLTRYLQRGLRNE